MLTVHLGKSTLTVQYVEGHFVESYYPTIENTFSKMIRYKSADYATEIVDTAGQVSSRGGSCCSRSRVREAFTAALDSCCAGWT